MRRIFLLIIFSVICSQVCFADTVRLKNGKEYQGQIVEKAAESVAMRVGTDLVRIPYSMMDEASLRAFKGDQPSAPAATPEGKSGATKAVHSRSGDVFRAAKFSSAATPHSNPKQFLNEYEAMVNSYLPRLMAAKRNRDISGYQRLVGQMTTKVQNFVNRTKQVSQGMSAEELRSFQSRLNAINQKYRALCTVP